MHARTTDDRDPGPRTVLGVLASLVVGGLVATLLAGPPSAAAEEPPGDSVTMVQANILSRLSVERFQADVREVLAEQPDFVSYNEVPLRNDAVLAPAGYDIHRRMKSRYTAATAVAWREDRWSAIDKGTYQISDYRQVPEGRSIKLGLRYANWVTLESPDGRRVSVVAVHIAPRDDDMPDLLRPSVRRLVGLVERLAPQGPVLVGGDFNVHYRSGRYPRDLLDPAGLVPTYDTLGTYFPTGDHHGATIDYVFNRGAKLLQANQHRPVELNSDHDAVVTDLSWLVDAPGDTQRLMSDPTGGDEARRRAVSALVERIRATRSGQTVELVSSGLGPWVVLRALRGAVERGVHVRLTTRSETLGTYERRLRRIVRASGDPRSAVVRCRGECRAAWRQSGMLRGFALVRDGSDRPSLRIDATRNLSSTMLERRTQLTFRTGELGLAKGEEMLASLS